MKKIIAAYVSTVLSIVSFCQTDVPESEINFQTIYLFKNVKTQKMMEVEDGAFNKGTKVQQYFPYAKNGLTDGFNQQWIIIPAGVREKHKVYHLINYGFLKYLDGFSPVTVQEGSDADNLLWIFQKVGSYWMIKSYLSQQFVEMANGMDDGASFTLGSFTGNTNQQFIVTQYIGQTGISSAISSQVNNILTGYNDNKALDATGAETDGGTLRIDQLSNSNPKQQWQIQLTSQYYELRPRNAGSRCMEILSFSVAEGGGAGFWNCVGGINQRWIIIPVVRQSGKYIFFNCNSGKCLAVSGGASNSNLVGVVQYTYANQENAKWKIKAAR